MEQYKIIRDRLRSDFPSVYVKDIDTTLKTNKYSYVASYYYLENALISNSLKLKAGAAWLHIKLYIRTI